MTQQHMDLSFPSNCRLKKSADFEQTYGQKQRASDQHVLVFANRNALDVTRCGLSVSKKHGNAVCRNRRKRLLREAFRLIRHQLPVGFDFILIPRVNSGAGLKEYQQSLKSLAKRIVRRIEKQSQRPKEK
ncbi:MAG: ribonuclease P protein component [Planctomycetaceae bacterium]|nr:ribonuclease P protein component [Planctomycetaceae bacterium]